MDISTAQSIKLAIVSASGLSKDALHIYVGMAVYLTLIAITRRQASAHDILNTLFWPTVLTLLWLLKCRNKTSGRP